jgi:hypothetical protein
MRLDPNISSLAESLPDLAGYDLRTIVCGDNTTSVRTTEFIFLKGYRDAGDAYLTYLYVYLLNSEYGRADFEFHEQLPHLVSYRIEDTEDTHTKKPMKSLVLEFEKGRLSFTFEKVFHVTSSYKVSELIAERSTP